MPTLREVYNQANGYVDPSSADIEKWMDTSKLKQGDVVHFASDFFIRDPHKRDGDNETAVQVRIRMGGVAAKVEAIRDDTPYFFHPVTVRLSSIPWESKNPNGVPDFCYLVRCRPTDLLTEAEYFNQQFPQRHFAGEGE